MTGIICSMVGATFGTAAVATIVRAKKGLVAIGNAQIDTAQSKFGGSSMLFDGTGDYVSSAANSDYNFGTSSFTIEFFIRFASVGTLYVPTALREGVSIGNGEWWCEVTATEKKMYWGFKNQAGTQYYVNLALAGTAFVANTWYHIALVNNAGTAQMYIDGTAVGATTSLSGSFGNSTTALWVGAGAGAYSLNGHMDEFRISKTARYTANFTPSTTPFDNDDNTVLLIHGSGTDASTFFEDDNGVRASRSLIANGNAQIDTAQYKFGGSSALFDGTGDYLIVGNTVDNDLALTSTTWTVEYWARINAHAGAYQATVAIWDDVGSTGSVYYFSTNMYNGTQKMGLAYYKADNTDSGALSFGSALATGVWKHHAFVRNGNTLTAYLDGVSQGTHDMTGVTIDITGYNSSSNTSLKMTIGAMTGGGGAFNGWLDEIRISKTARYTAAFTPPTEPFVNDANTVLLVHADGTDASTVFRDDNGATPVAYTSDAVAFDGTNDYYEATSISTTATDSKYLTFACTFYLASGGNSRNQHLMTARLGTANGENGWEICVQSGRFRYSSFDNSGSSTDMVYGDAQHLTEGAWNQMVAYIDHTSFANCKWYVNGVDRTSSLLNGASVGAVNLANYNINWGNTATTIKIGEESAVSGYNSGFSDFEGRISQIYVHNASGAPDIGKFWDHSVGKAKDLGTNGTSSGLAQPLIYHYGGTTTFPTNNGTGFASYTLTGYNNVSTNTGNSIYSSVRRQKNLQGINNAQIDTAQSKFGGASVLFDGVNDSLQITDVTLKPGCYANYTLEFWFKSNSASATEVLVFQGVNTAGTNDYWQLYVTSTNLVFNYPGDTKVNAAVTRDTNWHHVALVKQGTSNAIYYDGTQVGSSWTFTDANWNATDSDTFYFGIQQGDTTDFTGWMDEIRISNSARYTANFTAPTQAFTNDSNTILLCHFDGTDASTVFLDDNGIADHT